MLPSTPSITPTHRNFPQFLLIVPLIVQAVFSESFNGTFLTLHYSVRVRALGSFVSALCCITAGNLFGRLIDSKRLRLQTRARSAFVVATVLAGAWWVWSTVLNAEFHKHPETVYDWSTPGWGKGFGVYLATAWQFQLQYTFLYFIAGSLVTSSADVVRIGGLLRATESAAQAVSYGLNSLKTFQDIGVFFCPPAFHFIVSQRPFILFSLSLFSSFLSPFSSRHFLPFSLTLSPPSLLPVSHYFPSTVLTLPTRLLFPPPSSPFEGGSSLNFALWAVALLPAWLVIRKIGVEYYGKWQDDNSDEARERETDVATVNGGVVGAEGKEKGGL